MKTIAITGASGGIGRAVAQKFLAEGWAVGLMARRTEELTAVAAGQPNAHVLPIDVADPTQVETAFRTLAASTGRIDVLFNNAGIFTDPAPIDEIPVEDWINAVNVNLTGMFLCARAAFGQMRHQSPMGGRIINNGSVSAHTPRIGSTTYTTTKHGVTGLTKTLALDGRAFDICCGQIDIGNAESPMMHDMAKRNADAGLAPPPMIEVDLIVDAVLAMANLPLNANTLFQTIMATQMPFVGRG